MRSQRRTALAAAACLLLAAVGCSAGEGGAVAAAGGVIRIASYDFTENQTLAHVYAQALRAAGFRTEVIEGIGTREVVHPALQQDRVDLVVDYLGTALEFIEPGSSKAGGDLAVRAALSRRLRERGIEMAAHAPAEDQNGFAVTTEFARRHSASTLSELRALAPSLTFGGPPECETRQYCLVGLRHTYRLEFKAFKAIESRSATVASLLTGEIDVGMLETTDARLALGRLVLLADDRGLQPAENIVPLVRRDVLAAGGEAMRSALDRVSARLTTAEVIGLNRAVEVDGLASDQAAGEWVRTQLGAAAA